MDGTLKSIPGNAPMQDRTRFFERTLDMLCIAGFDGYFKDVNSVWEHTLGYTRGDLLGQPYLSFVHPMDREATREEARKIAEGHRSVSFENRYRCKDGGYRWLLWNAAPVPEEHLIYASARDITERKRLERHLVTQYAVARVLAGNAQLAEAAPEILRLIAETMDWEVGGIWLVDESAHVLRCLNVWQTPGAEAAEFAAATRTVVFAPGAGLPGRVWQQEKAAWISDVIKDVNFPRSLTAAAAGLHAAFAFPIVLDGTVIGVFEFFSREHRPPDEPLLQMMTALGSQIGQFAGRKTAEESQARLIRELREALQNVKTLRGLLPICCKCNKIRDERGAWNRLEEYIVARSDADFTHGICGDCARQEHPDWDDYR